MIIATSIPLAILGSIITLSALGETLNIMTLGGLALAVGILVDDATVTIENINWHLEHGKEVETAILDGAAQIVTPAFVSLLCICIVFVPMFFLDGVARFLFVPMAEAVMFAMISSFILSRTLVPTMAKYLLKQHVHVDPQTAPRSRNPLVRFQRAFEARFERVRAGYHGLLELALLSRNRTRFISGFLGFVVVSFALVPFLGRNFFPDVDAGQILMHARAPVGLRVEQTTQISPRSSAISGRSFRPMKWARWLTTSACRSAVSTPPTTIRARSAPRTATYRFRSRRTIARPPNTCANCANACRAISRA